MCWWHDGFTRLWNLVIHDTNTGLDLRLYWLAQGRHRTGVARHGTAPAHGAEAVPCSTGPGWPGPAGPPPTGRRPYLAQPALGGWALQGPRPKGGGHASLSQPEFMLPMATTCSTPKGKLKWFRVAHEGGVGVAVGKRLQGAQRRHWLGRCLCCWYWPTLDRPGDEWGVPYGTPGDRALSPCHEQGWLHQPQFHDTNTGLDLRLYWLAQGRHRTGVARHGTAPAHGAEAVPCSTGPGWPGPAGPPPTGRRPYLARPALGGWALQGPRPKGGGHASLSQPGFMLPMATTCSTQWG